MEFFFYLFAVLSVLGALPLLVVRSPVACVLSLVGTMVALAALFVLLGHEFLAALQVLIYAGAILVLFLFVIMLLNLRAERPYIIRWTLPKVLGFGFTLAILGQLLAVMTSSRAVLGPAGDYPAERLAEEGTISLVGELLFTEYVLPFEVISVLLMVAVMGAVILAKRHPAPAQEEGE